MSDLPLMFRARQTFVRPVVDDIPARVRQEFDKIELGKRIQPGESVAITAGSRGIANIAQIVAAVAQTVRDYGGLPFVVPAMGSHGGADAEGQLNVLATFGITAAKIGCPIHASMDTEVIGESKWGFPIYFDRMAYRADHVLVCNRVKPHTDFAGTYQSGLLKMMLIGLGKFNGAKNYHHATMDHGLDAVVEDVAPKIFATGKITAGLAIVENGYDETAHLEAVDPDRFLERDPELLQMAIQWLGRLPFDDIDVLIIDEIGKNISGTGMDTNVVGRKFNDHEAVPGETPRVRRIVIRGLSKESKGNAVGLGMCEFCRTRAVEQMDPRSTFINGITSGHVSAAMVPIHFATDREVLAQALQTIGLTKPDRARVVWIRNTLRLAEFECSAAYLEEVAGMEHVQVLSELRPLPIGDDGNLPEAISL